MTHDLPIACTLSGPELRERESTTLAALRAQVRHVEAGPDGYTLELTGAPGTREFLSAWLEPGTR